MILIGLEIYPFTEAKGDPYLEEVINIADRIAFSKFHLSNHKLMIKKEDMNCYQWTFANFYFAIAWRMRDIFS